MMNDFLGQLIPQRRDGNSSPANRRRDNPGEETSVAMSGARLIVTIGLVCMLTNLQPQCYGQGLEQSADSLVSGVLIPANATMDRAWDVPRNPLTMPLNAPDSLAKKIKRGFRNFTNTPRYARRFSGGGMSCNNCHPNAGQKEKMLPLVGVAKFFPEYNKRLGRSFSLEDRIVGCFLRSMNATGAGSGKVSVRHESELASATLSPTCEEVEAVSTYISWLSSGVSEKDSILWRGHNTIPASKLIPIDMLSAKLGKKLYVEKCSTCHGLNGQGVEIGDKKAGPLWGPRSWNDGAGAARTYTLAGLIRHPMPYLDPGSLTDEDAQQIAAYITSKPRPMFPYKDKDYLTEKIPLDAVYYERLYKKNPFVGK